MEHNRSRFIVGRIFDEAFHTYLSRNMLPRQIDTLVAYTRELKALSEQVLELTKRLREEWLKE